MYMAKFGNINAIGNRGGQPLYDRKLSAAVRSLTLTKIKEILETPIVKMNADDYSFYKQLILSLSHNVLPRLQEVTGEDGNPISVEMKSISTFLKEVANGDTTGDIQNKADSKAAL